MEAFGYSASLCISLYMTYRVLCCAHRRSQAFCLGGAPGRRHPTLHQSCTRLKLSRADGVCERSSSQQSHRWNTRAKKIEFDLGEITFGGGFL